VSVFAEILLRCSRAEKKELQEKQKIKTKKMQNKKKKQHQN
jgi:hypothetical protein